MNERMHLVLNGRVAARARKIKMRYEELLGYNIDSRQFVDDLIDRTNNKLLIAIQDIQDDEQSKRENSQPVFCDGGS